MNLRTLRSEAAERTTAPMAAAATHLREALRLLLRAPVASLLAVVALTLGLVLTALTTWTLGRTGAMTAALEADLRLHLALDPGLDEAQTKTALLAIAAVEGVGSVRWIGPKEQRATLTAELGEDLLAGLDDAVFPEGGMAEVVLARGAVTDLAAADALVAKLSAIAEVKGVDGLPYDPRHVRVLFDAAAVVRLGGGLLALMALLVAALCVHLIVRDGLSSSRAAIALLEAFGATRTFVRARFLAAATLLGLLSAVGAFAFALVLEGPLSDLVELLPHDGGASGLLGAPLLAWAFVGGPALALVGAWLALRARGETT